MIPNMKRSQKGPRPQAKAVAPNSHQSKAPPRLLKSWEEMVVNPTDSIPVRTPSSSPYTGAVRTFVRTVAVSSNGPADRFSMVVRPNIQNTLSIALDNEVVLPASWELITPSANFYAGNRHDNYIPLFGDLAVYDTTPPSVQIGEFHNSFDSIAGFPFWEINSPVGNEINIIVGTNAVEVALYRRGRLTGTWTKQSSLLTSKGYVTFIVPAVAAGPSDGISGYAIMTSTPLTHEVKPSIAFLSQGGPTPTLGENACYDLFQTDAITLGRVSSYRVTALSVLASYSGNQFNDGGVIAAARVRSNFCYEGAHYESLTALQDHSYKGPIKLGAYAWWLPYSIDELEFRHPFDVDHGTDLRIAGIFEDDAGQLQVSIAMTVEFYSPLQIFEHEPGPALDDSFVRAYHSLDHFPAATCNPKHTEILKSILKSAAKGAKGAGSFLLNNPQMALSLLSLL
jgi:hypothetical protein